MMGNLIFFLKLDFLFIFYYTFFMRNLEFIIVITTTDKKEEAERLTTEVLRERLAACAHIIEIESFYWWKGQLERSKEYRVEFKTKLTLLEVLKNKLKSIHSYEVPEIVALPLIDGGEEYFKWLENETLKN